MFFYNHDGSKNSPYNLRHTIKKDMFFFSGQTELILVGQWPSLSPLLPVPYWLRACLWSDAKEKGTYRERNGSSMFSSL